LRSEADGEDDAFLRAGGLSREAVRRRPIIGICSSWSELNPCNMGLRDLPESVKRGVTAAGGTAVVFPTILLAENFIVPTTMLFERPDSGMIIRKSRTPK
jgi:dihydroxy-acid dehydratase